MKTRPFILAATATLAVLAALGGAYWCGRKALPALPARLAEQLRAHGLAVAYREAIIPPSGLSLTLRQVTASGSGLPFALRAESVVAGLKLRPRWPPATFFIDLQHVEIAPTVPAASPIAQAASPPRLLELALTLSHLEIGVTDLAVPSRGLQNINGGCEVYELRFGPDGPDQLALHHQLALGDWSAAPWLKGLRWSGDSLYRRGDWHARKQLISLGPLRIRASGRYDWASGKWEAEARLPRTHLEHGGEIEAGARAQGIAANLPSINAEGTVRARHVHLILDQPSWKGELRFDLGADLIRDQSLSINAAGSADLTPMEIKRGQEFAKAAGVPLSIDFALNGNDRRIAFTRGDLQLGRIALSLGGELFMGPQLNGNLQARFSSAPLAAWERFLPRYASWATPGTISGEVGYRGLLVPRPAGKIEGSLEARDLVLNGAVPYLQKALEGLKHVPVLGLAVKPSPLDGKVNRLSGHFRWDAGTAVFSSLALNGSQFDASAPELIVDAQRHVTGRVLWSPHETLMATPTLEILRDPTTGHADLPLHVDGPLASPSFSIDQPLLLARALELLRRSPRPSPPKAHARAESRHRRKRRS